MNTRLKNLEEQEWLKLAQQAEWSVTKLAKLCKVSLRGLELHFLKKMRSTPKNWLVGQRQKQALELLRDGSMVKEAAAQLAYKHANHFSREFKKHWGYCPTQNAPIGAQARKLRVLS
jgi:transcriptional regulator GlxA family with amidase domain